VGGLLVVLSHPDDESMGTGGLILRHTRADIAVHLICATRGEKGWMGKPPGAREEDLAAIRTQELDDAAAALGLSSVELWDYPDGGVPKSDLGEITTRIGEQIARLEPAAVVGWGPDGGYGHPDHITMGRCTDAAVEALPESKRPGLYHIAVDDELTRFYKEALELGGESGDGLPLIAAEHVDLVLELSPDEVQMKVRAIDCHQSQLEQWRIEIRNHPHLMQSGYGREPYISLSPRRLALAPSGLLGEFA
jgi:LmbE family N-acetylglucosaminyl deacetylase